MKTKLEQRAEDLIDLKNWDSKINALDEAWLRGYDYAKKELEKVKE